MRPIRLFGAVLAGALSFITPVPGQPAPGPVGPPPPPAGVVGPGAPKGGEFGGKSLDGWIKQLSDPDASERQEATQAVLAFGPDARKAVPALTRLLVDRDSSVRANAALALGSIGVEDPAQAKDAVSALTRMLADSQGAVRLQAALALGKLGPKVAHTAVGDLMLSLRDLNSWEIRRAAALSLGQLGYEPDGHADPRVLNALVGSLADRVVLVRLAVIRGIIQLGPTRNPQDTGAAKSSLLRLLQDKDKVVQIWARVAVMRLDKTLISDTYLTPISQGLLSPDQAVRVQAADALGVLGAEAKSKAPDLAAALRHEDPATVFAAIVAVGHMGPSARVAMPDLQKLTTHTDPVIKNAAEQAIRMVQGSGVPGAGPGRPAGQ
jgi:HEAT repeat protein